MTTFLSSIITTVFARTCKCIFILLFALAVINSANAQCPSGSIVYVNANLPGGNHDGSSWTNAYTSLQDALSAVKNCTTAKQIWVAKGTYYPDSAFRLQNKLALYGGFAGNENNLTARNIAANKSILSGDLNRNNKPDNGDAISVVISLNVNSTAVLDGFTITGSFSEIQPPIFDDPSSFDPLSDSVEFFGGGMFNVFGSPSVNNCIFSGNYSFAGGGMFNFYKANPQITNCVFSGDSAVGGAGMFNFYQCNPQLMNCVFSGNVSGIGGGLGNFSNSNPILVGCTLSGNSSSQGGSGIWNDNSISQLTNCIIWNNAELRGTGTREASIAGDAVIKYSLVQNITTDDSNGNLDGITYKDLANYPFFLSPLNPTKATSTVGDFHLLCGSPVIDNGNNDANKLSTDIDGKTRIKNEIIDIGAYEQQSICPVISKILYVDSANVSGQHDGNSWNSAFTNLQDALSVARLYSKVQQIWVAKGTYYPGADTLSTFRLKNNLAIYGGFNGTETRLTARDWKKNVTILSGDINKNNIPDRGDNANVTIGSGTNNSAILDGFTITCGYNNTLFDPYGRDENGNRPTTPEEIFASLKGWGGGGMFNNSGSPVVSNCIFTSNWSLYSGGGMMNYYRSNPVISNCTFSDNISEGNTFFGRFLGGGGMANHTYSNPIINNCLFSGNSALYIGGGMLNYGYCNPVITNCVFSGDSASSGAGLVGLENCNLKITNCTFSGNSATNDAGGVAFGINSNLVIANSIIWNNTDGSGTGTARASLNFDKLPVITHCLIQNITASDNNGNLDGKTNAGNVNYPLFAMPMDLITMPNNTGNLRLQFGSPAINKGDNSADSSSKDLAGNSRIIDDIIDLGAYENQGFSCPAGNILYVDANTKGDNNGASWKSAFTTLQSALSLANSCSVVKQIWVAKGTYYPDSSFELKNNLAIYGGFAGTETSLASRNLKKNVTILSGDINKNNTSDAGDAQHVVVSRLYSDGTAILDGFTISGAYSASGNNGGGMINTNSSPTISNCIFSGNVSGSNGGGMYNGSSSYPVITNCIFSGNLALVSGGGMANSASSPVIINCTFSGNSSNSVGGGIYNLVSNPIITNCIIWNNKDNSGTGTKTASMYNDRFDVPVIKYSLIQNTTSADGYGNMDGITNATNNNYPSFAAVSDPLIAPSKGGDLHLQCISPAIDKGDNDIDALLKDLEGSSRIINGKIDFGAYENQGNCCPSGDIVYVDSSNSSAGLHDGTSWATAFTNLQPALYITKNCTAGKQIWVAKGTYYPDSSFELKNNLAIYGGFAGTETSLASRNLKNNITILSGDINKSNTPDAGDAVHVITSSFTDGTAILDGFTITGAYSASANNGGGMINTNSSPTVSNCIFAGNVAGSNGGGMYNGSYSYPVIINCIFSGNLALGSGGGMANSASSPVITNCTFSGNSSNGAGGGIYDFISNPVITNCIIWNNKDNSGVGTKTASMYNDQFDFPVIKYSLIQNTTSADGNGNLDGISNSANNNYPLFAEVSDPSITSSKGGNFHLQCPSPAIDKGDNNADTLATDPNGNSRIFNNTIDLGAYENQDVCAQTTTTAITNSGNPSCYGSLVKFTATVLLNNSENIPAASGTVTFTQGTTVLANNISIDANGHASFSTDTLGTGLHTIVATYNAPQGFTTSSGFVNQVVNAKTTGSISGGGTYCSGMNTSANLILTVSGSGTVSGTLSDGTPFSGTAPAIRVAVSPTVTTTYSIKSLSDANCTAQAADLPGSANVTVKPLPPVAAISGNSQLIKGTSMQLSNATKGGVWSSSNTSVAKVNKTGAVKGISAGNCKIYYTLTSGGCSAVASKSITVYNPLTASVSISKILCNGGTATLTIKASGGSGGYKYSLYGGKFQAGNIFQSSNTFTVPAGKYIIIVTDRMANQLTLREVSVGQPALLAIKLKSIKNASSKTSANGSFTVSGSGGVSGYKYSKNGGASYQSSGTFSNLKTGSYKISVKDANNCVALNYLTVKVGYNKQNVPLARNALTNESDDADIKKSDDENVKVSAIVFPNPSISDFNLQLKSSKDETVEIRVTDILGHAVYHTRGNATGLYKFGEHFTPGMYIVEVVYKEEIRTLKIIKQ